LDPNISWPGVLSQAKAMLRALRPRSTRASRAHSAVKSVAVKRKPQQQPQQQQQQT